MAVMHCSPVCDAAPVPRTNTSHVGLLRLARVFTPCCLLLICQVHESHGQIHVGADVAFSTKYVWRGITRTDDAAIQPDIYVAASPGNGFLTAGWWANLGGASDFELWAEYSARFQPLDGALGWVRYSFERAPGNSGNNGELITNEIYARLQLTSVPLHPKVSVWYDVDKVKGAYVEGSLDLRIPLLPLRLGPMRSIHLSGLAAWSAGQEVKDAGPSEAAHFAESGLTHLDFSLWSSFFLAEFWSITPVLHFQINEDTITKLTGGNPAESSATKFWFIIFVSWGHEFAVAEE